MITRIYANDKRFKPIEFRKGLNIVLADRQKESDAKDSRNGVGKTTLIHIIHFCLGADLSKKVLPVNEIEDWIFFFEMDLKGIQFTASRTIESPGTIEVEGIEGDLPLSPEIDEEMGKQFYKLADWKKLLEICLFDLRGGRENKYIPSFRGLINYFVRVGLGAYNKPFLYFQNQKGWQTQVLNAYLLGLNWRHATGAQRLKDKNSAAKALGTAIKTSIIPSKGELEADRVRLQKEVTNEEKALSEFKIHPRYSELQTSANSLTIKIKDLNNKNIILTRKLSRYEDSISSESEPEMSSVLSLYEDVGVHFSESLKKSLEEAKKFHTEIVKNRKDFLNTEISEINTQLSDNEDEIKRLDGERAEVLRLLSTHGALEEYTKFQNELLEKKAKLEALKEKINDIQSMTKKGKEIKAERIKLDSKLARDFEDSRPRWEKAIEWFNENSQALYNNPGNLIINISENGVVTENAYKFDVEIPRSTSEGVGRMKIFCYDLMLVEKFTKDKGINFLVHDTTMFDGVDKRQVAHALEHADKKGKGVGFQYICFFNSDSLPMEDFSDEFRLDDYVRLRLSDKRPEDSLLGFHFELPRK